MPSALSARAQLLTDGFCVSPGFLSIEECAEYRALCAELYRAQNAEERLARWSAGSLISFRASEALGRLAASGRAHALLRTLGFPDPRLSNAYVVHKPARSPRLFWHQDWFAWGHPASYEANPSQVGVLVYLQATSPENGALRVIPGSHRRRHALHLPVSLERTRWLRRGLDLSLPEFQTAPDEVDVPLREGDAVLLDARTLHATHENRTDEARSLLLFWLAGDFAALAPDLQSLYGEIAVAPEWPQELADQWRALGTYPAPATPAVQAWAPDDRLKP